MKLLVLQTWVTFDGSPHNAQTLQLQTQKSRSETIAMPMISIIQQGFLSVCSIVGKMLYSYIICKWRCSSRWSSDGQDDNVSLLLTFVLHGVINANFCSFIAIVIPYSVCWVHMGVLSTLGVFNTARVYVEYRGGRVFSTMGDIMIYMRDIISTVRDVQYPTFFMFSTVGRYYDACGGCSVPQHLSWYPSTVLNTHTGWLFHLCQLGTCPGSEVPDIKKPSTMLKIMCEIKCFLCQVSLQLVTTKISWHLGYDNSHGIYWNLKGKLSSAVLHINKFTSKEMAT